MPPLQLNVPKKMRNYIQNNPKKNAARFNSVIYCPISEKKTDCMSKYREMEGKKIKVDCDQKFQLAIR
jgi:hypothetical protein